MSIGANIFIVLFAVIALVYHTEASKDSIEIVTKNGAYYHANITWTLRNFLHLPVWSIQSPYFPADNKNGLQWFLIAVTNSPRDGNGDVDLMVYPLGHQKQNITNLSVDFQCALIDTNGQRKFKKSKPRYNILDPGTTPFYFTPFLSRKTLMQNQSQLLPNGHLTFECSLEGFVKRSSQNSTLDYLTTVEKGQPVVQSDCTKNIAENTMRKLRADGYQLQSDIVLTTSGKKFKGHKKILSPLLSKFASAETSPLDLSNSVNENELKDLLSFMYTGKANNLGITCDKLYGFAKKYELSCLWKVCEDVLIGKLNRYNKAQLLAFSNENRAVKLRKAVLDCIASDKC